ncbi:MAG: thioredoxin family protein [Chitinophagaceae bacterium]
MNQNRKTAGVKMFSFILCLICSISVQGQAVRFFEGTVEEAITKATQEKKYIYIDAYTDWCTPCIKMDKDLFADSASAAFLNERFIVLKRECWTDSAGLLFRDEFFAYAYPTHYILTPQGELCFAFSGYGDRQIFIDRLKDFLQKGASPTKAFIGSKLTGQSKFYDLVNYSLKAGRNLVLSFEYKWDSVSKRGDLISLSFDTAQLGQRLSALKKSLKIEEYFYNLFTAAIIYHLQGDYHTSQVFVRKAYKMGNVPFRANRFPASPARLRLLLFLEDLNAKKISPHSS